MNKRTTNWIDTILNQVSKLDDKGAEILNNCGRECAKSGTLLDSARKIKEKYPDEKDPLILLNAFKMEYYNSPNLFIEEDKVTLTFEKCTCHLVQKGVTNPSLCNCTVGYTKQIFETLLSHPVEVKLTKTILRGDEVCEQEIAL